MLVGRCGTFIQRNPKQTEKKSLLLWIGAEVVRGPRFSVVITED